MKSWHCRLFFKPSIDGQVNNMLEKINSPEDLKAIPEKDLPLLCQEIRARITDVVRQNGGHLASNLGAVELTVAQHRIFSSPRDKIIFDVGHQSYTHKLLTGRYEAFSSIRRYKGISGFPKLEESPHDIFDTGHSSTSISAALGIAAARDLQGDSYDVIANIGDGALTGGMALEALNHLGHMGAKIIIILNDNEMSISAPVGAIAKQLTRISSGSAYRNLKYRITTILVKSAAGRRFRRVLSRVKSLIKHLFSTKGAFFEHFGLTYLGPYDGHDIIGLEEALRLARKTDRPTLVHVITKKGKGNEEAEFNPEKFHGVSPSGKGRAQSFTEVFGSYLLKKGKEDQRITAITAAMCTGTGMDAFREALPERFFDVSIAEQHGLTFAAGQAANGLRPVISIYATFMQRGVDQVIHDIAMQKLPVVMILDRAGLVGEDGETHHGVFDIALFSNIPNLTMMEPQNASELQLMMDYALAQSGPVMIRFPKGSAEEEAQQPAPLELGWGICLRKMQGSTIAIVALGAEISTGRKLGEILERDGIISDLYQGRFISPLSQGFLEILEGYETVITLENHVERGGYGTKLRALLNKPAVLAYGLPNRYISHGSIPQLREESGLTPEALRQRIREDLGV